MTTLKQTKKIPLSSAHCSDNCSFFSPQNSYISRVNDSLFRVFSEVYSVAWIKSPGHKHMAVLKIYIGNGFDFVPHCKHFQALAGLLATANKGRTHLKFPVERPVRRAFDLDWENSWVGTTHICLSFTPPPPSKNVPSNSQIFICPQQPLPLLIIDHGRGKSMELHNVCLK